VLQVEVEVLSAGVRHELILEKSPGAMDKEEIRRRLALLGELKVHPRDAQPNVALVARAERLYEESLGQKREIIQQWLTRFLAVVETQDTTLIDRHRKELDSALDELENQRL
jgi:molecular chaperone HscC